MNTFNTVVKFFVDCGPFLYPSLLMMSLGLAIVSFAPLATKEFPELHSWLASWMMPAPK